MPWLSVVPALGMIAPLLAARGFHSRRAVQTMLASTVGVACIIATVGLAMFPIILPSSTNLGDALTVFDASSSRATLRNMLIATVILLPIVLIYTAWVYRVLRGKVGEDTIKRAGSTAY